MSTEGVPGQRGWSLVEPHWLVLNQSWDEGPTAFLKRLASVPTRAAQIYAGNWCVSEVQNGGLLQFFWNTTGILAPEALSCFKALGAAEPAAILARAMQHFGLSYPREREARLAILGGADGALPQLSPFEAEDDAFYDWFEQEQHNWGALIDRYADGA